jgi:hypothetical protein
VSRSRPFRPRFPRGNGDAVPATYRSILGPLLIELWHSQLGIATVSGNADTWTGQVGGRVLQAPAAGQRPTYAADGTVFGGKPVVQCDHAAVKLMRSAVLSTVVASGTRPWWYSIARSRTLTGNVECLFGYGDTSVDNLCFQLNSAVFAALSGFSGVSTTLDTARHSLAIWLDGVNVNIALDNAAPTTVGGTGAITTNLTQVALGGNSVSAGQAGDWSIALHLVCSSKPSAAQIAAVEALALREFPP